MIQRRTTALSLTLALLAGIATSGMSGVAAAADPSLAIQSVTLIDASTDRPIAGRESVASSISIDLATTTAGTMNFRVNASADVASIRASVDGTSLVDSVSPYSVLGDTDGNYVEWRPTIGTHDLAVTGFSRTRGKGPAGPLFAIEVRVFDSGVPAGQSPTPAPSPTPPAPPSGSVAPVPMPSPSAPPASGTNVSGIRIPPPPDGYRRGHFTEFPNAQRLGQPPHPDTALHLKPRPSVAGDCTYRDSSGRGLYCWKKTTTEGNGVLRQWLHTETTCGMSTSVHDPSGRCNYVSAPLWTEGKRSDYIVSVVARFDDIPGRKIAYLSWCGPSVGTAGYCEDNFPEMQLSHGTCKGYAFHHHASRTTKESFPTCVDPNTWHLYQMHVSSGRFVTFSLDGRVIGRSTQYVTSDPTFWVAQAETLMGGTPLPLPHAQGAIEWDAFAVDIPAVTVLVVPTLQ